MQEYRPGGFQILPPVVKNLLIINGIGFLAFMLLGEIVHEYLGLHFISSDKFMVHQFVTYMFMHGGFGHIFFNMLALWMFGGVLENYWGRKKFLTFYMVTALGAAGTHMAYTGYKLYPAFEYERTGNVESYYEFMSRNSRSINPAYLNQTDVAVQSESDLPLEERVTMNSMVSEVKNYIEDIPVVGASGAIYGLLLAFGMLFPNSLIYMYFFIPIKAKYFVIIFGLLELMAGFYEARGDNIAHFAHLGGMIFGFFMIKYWDRRARNRFY